MARIEKNDNGTIVVNDKVIEKLIIEELLKMPDSIILCNKKGKIIKDKSNALIAPDYSDAVNFKETIRSRDVNIHIITMFGNSISLLCDELFAKVDSIFDSLMLRRPGCVTINIRGVRTSTGNIVQREIEVEHCND